MDPDQFKAEFDQALATMSDEEIVAAFAEMGCEVEIEKPTTRDTER